MNILDICQEAVAHGFISYELALKLNQLLWSKQLNTVELATLEFVSRRIQAGKIVVAPQPIGHFPKSMQQVD